MNLYLISQKENNDLDTYDSAVVAAESEDDARNIHPDFTVWRYDWWNRTWCRSPDKVNVKLLCEGYKGDKGVILASFNAG